MPLPLDAIGLCDARHAQALVRSTVSSVDFIEVPAEEDLLAKFYWNKYTVSLFTVFQFRILLSSFLFFYFFIF